MAKFNIQHHLALLGRRVRGVEVFLGFTRPFEGIVECVAVQRSSEGYYVEFCVGGDFIAAEDCTELETVLAA